MRSDRLLPLLRAEQARHGCISPEAMMRIAAEVGVSPAVVYGVATFYHELRPGTGQALVVRVCDSPSCHLAGSEEILAALERLARGGIRVERVGCLGQCDRSPALICGNRLHVRVRPRELPLLIRLALGDGQAAPDAGPQGGERHGGN